MGSVLTPLLSSLEQASALPNACTTCGRCAEICPAGIPLPDLLRDLRNEENRQKLTAPRWRRGLKIHAWLARHPALYHALTGLAVRVLHVLGGKRGRIKRLPFARGWTSQRDFPAPQDKTFMQLYKAQERRADER
jgi:L-lactate dehydrogenase complex protein LldF